MKKVRGSQAAIVVLKWVGQIFSLWVSLMIDKKLQIHHLSMLVTLIALTNDD